ncbi:hypothetical protein M3914_003364 [Vibrio metschnikovii]|nr:hypothetical protein [Vibrio metschnikovii]
MSDLSILKFPTGRTAQQVKKDAQRLKKINRISLNEALDQCAKDNGVDLPWHVALRTLEQDTTIKLTLSMPSTIHKAHDKLIKPQLKLDNKGTVGMILGEPGSGKSVMIAGYIEQALDIGYQVQFIDLAYGFKELYENGTQHPTDLALNKILQLKTKYPEKLHFIDLNEPLVSDQDKNIVVIDDCGSIINDHPNKTEFYDKLVQYITANGKVLLAEQDEESLTNEVNQHVNQEKIGFIAVSGYSYKTAIKISYPKELSSLLIKNDAGLMPWIIFTHKGISIGYHTK